MTSPVRELIQILQQLAGDGLAAVVAFGNILSRDFESGDALARTVAVFREVDLDVLRRFSEYGPNLGRNRITAPLIMTPQFIDASRDSFPLELLEIRQTHVILAGDDFFSNLELENEHIRLQCERELKRLQMRMQQGLLAAAGHEPSIEMLEMDISEHALRTLMGLLWLKGRRESMQGIEIVSACEKLTRAALTGLRAGMDHGVEHGWKQFQALYQDIEALAAIANA
jgi:hypothetical protein